MTAARAGTYALPKDDHRSLLVVVMPPRMMVEADLVSEIGFQPDEARDAGMAFGDTLYALSRMVAEREPDALEDVSDQSLDAALRLTEDQTLDALMALRSTGAGLRAQLSSEAQSKLRYNGFPAAEAGVDPALTFQDVGGTAPVLWDMLYEGSQAGVPNWERFWGFRAPITHWTTLTRTPEIRLRNGIFAATNEDLRFAGREVRRIGAGLPVVRETVDGAFADRVRRELLQRLKGDEAQVDAWWNERRSGAAPDEWLTRYIDFLELSAGRARVWKEDALVDIFHSNFHHDVIHFACHCVPSTKSRFLSRLDLKVAGEVVSLEVSRLDSDLQRELHTFEDRGPLVFLNACGTAEQRASHEPPGFPESWIRRQGALAVIATLCPVPDHFAHAFALKFYEELLRPRQADAASRPRYLAEALLATRRYFMDVHGNPLGLAYVLYATKGAHLVEDLPEAGSGP